MITDAQVKAAADALLSRVNAPEQEIYAAARAALEAAQHESGAVDGGELHRLKMTLRASERSYQLWLRAAKAALAGDPRDLRLRVEIAEAPPLNIVASAP